jgi:hypothetical protein
MNDLVQYLNHRIKALEDANSELRNEVRQLTGYVFDLCQNDLPEDYKRVIKHEVFGGEINYEYLKDKDDENR